MTPEKRREQRRNEDASFRTQASLENERLQERIKALESLLARVGDKLCLIVRYEGDEADKLLGEIDAILPKTDGDNNG